MQTRLADCGHRAEGLGTATGPTAVQGYQRTRRERRPHARIWPRAVLTTSCCWCCRLITHNEW